MSMIPPYFLHRPNHSIARCGCGFYAYFEGSNDYGDASRVNAVVEGYGDVHLGTRGFRASKARIVAMHLPTARRGAWHRFRHWLADSNMGAAMGGLSLYPIVFGLVYTFASPAHLAWALLAAFGIAALAVSFSSLLTIGDDCSRRSPLTRETLAAIRAKYPDVAVFSTFDAMVEAYPASRAEDFQ